MKYADFVLVSTDGTVHPIYTNETSISLSASSTSGVTGVSGGVDHLLTSADPTNTTYYYHGDQIGSSRLMTVHEGWPVWQGTFLPFGEEYNPEITTNHYKFTGKERDSESGLDNFGARYYSSSMGRFASADWSSAPEPIPYANFRDPQSLNLYAYVRNNPLSHADPDGHCDPDGKHCFWQKLGNWFKGNGFKTNLQLAPQGTVTTVTVESHPRLTPAQRRYAIQQGLNLTMMVMTMGAMEAANMGGGEGESTVTSDETAAIDAAAESAAGEEASNAANLTNLETSLASEQQVGEAGTVMAGPGARVPFRDAERIAQEYGGSPSDWVKVSSSSYTARDGTKFETHWVENVKTGQRVEFKTKFP